MNEVSAPILLDKLDVGFQEQYPDIEVELIVDNRLLDIVAGQARPPEDWIQAIMSLKKRAGSHLATAQIRSTAVKGLEAKPIIDSLLEIQDAQHQRNNRLRVVNFTRLFIDVEFRTR